MKSKITIIILCMAVFSGTLSAQDVETLDVMYTTGGSTWKGNIISWGQDTIIFQTLSGLEVRFPSHEVKRVKQRVISGGKLEKKYAFSEHGLYQVGQFAVSSGPAPGLSATYAIGHRFSRLWSLGIGSGYENFEFGDARRIIPIFAETRGYLTAKRITPYFALRAGYGIALKNRDFGIQKATGGLLVNPEFGWRFSGNAGANFYAGIGAHFQKATYDIQWPWSEDRIIDRYWFQRTEIKVGWVF